MNCDEGFSSKLNLVGTFSGLSELENYQYFLNNREGYLCILDKILTVLLK